MEAPKICELVPEIKRISGIYFLMDINGDVIYIGQSTNIIMRIKHHKTEKEGLEQDRLSDVSRSYKNWNTAAYIPVPINWLNDVEAAFINIYQPKCNGWLAGIEKNGIKATNKTTENYELALKWVKDVLPC